MSTAIYFTIGVDRLAKFTGGAASDVVVAGAFIDGDVSFDQRR